MDLIIKPTNRCNFRCTYCARGGQSTSTDMTVDDFKAFFDTYKQYPIRTVIVNGGDPLMMPPSFYLSCIEYALKYHPDCIFSFTSNMWDFYKNPDKWKPIITHRNVGFITSFQLDNSRRLSDRTVFDINLFDNVQQAYYQVTGKYLDFISVLNDRNCDRYLDVIEIARKYDVVCKLNPEVQSGYGKSFSYAKMISIYLDLIDKNLDKYEYNCRQLNDIVYRNKRVANICPFCTHCERGIRCIGPDLHVHYCSSLNDDQDRFQNVSQWPSTYFYLKSECLSCPYFEICNGCKKQVFDIKTYGNVQDHCTSIKAILKRWYDGHKC